MPTSHSQSASLLSGCSLAAACVAVLNTADAREKAHMAQVAAHLWREGALEHVFDTLPPARPARPAKPELCRPGQVPKRRRGGTDTTKMAFIHALAHIELNAIDLAFDIIARFGADMPRAFTDDWMKVGCDEGIHFLLLDDFMRAHACAYGDMKAHDGLWISATDTAHDLPARLAIVPMVLEARGLDVTPPTIERLRSSGDTEAADILERIYTDEITHVAAGTRWFSYLAKQAGADEKALFQTLVQTYFKGQLRPPFNTQARLAAGMPVEFYESLV